MYFYILKARQYDKTLFLEMHKYENSNKSFS